MCCQPCARELAAPATKIARNTRRRRTYPSIKTSVRFSAPAGTVLGREPLFKERRSFCAFQAPAHGVHHAASQCVARSVESQPVRKVNFAGQSLNSERSIAHFEESLLKNDSQRLVAQNFLRAYVIQRGPEAVSRLNFHEIL